MDRLSTGKSLSTLKSNNSKYKMYYDSIFASIPYLKIIVKKTVKGLQGFSGMNHNFVKKT